MTAFLLVARKAIGMLAALWVASMLIFALLAVLPGDPAEMMASRGGTRPTPEAIAAVRAQFGLDRPLPVRYADWLAHAARGDLARSWMTGAPVADLLGQRLGPTVLLGAATLLAGSLLTFLLGGLAAIRPGGVLDHATRLLAVVATAIPSFVLSLLAIRFLAVGLGLGSVIGDGTFRTLPLPAAVGALGLTAYWVRPFRAQVADALATDWAVACRARGLSEHRLLFVHALPNAMVKFMPFLGVGLAGILAGSVFIESVFSWPGVGPFVVDAIKRRDLPIIQGFTLIAVAFYIASTALTDLAVALLDPRHQPRPAAA